ncbi:COX assembly mitochondrial protein homolog [Watersipora subatra]|uniref:COX assembly mitochondrial protein homolog n=1 Tax=Watersipora subatra TaxID=2589382 RepID=UPI00355B934F
MSSATTAVDESSFAETEKPIQEPPHQQRVVGERIWGPYKVRDTLSNANNSFQGPMGLGDPEDETLRRHEKEMLIPKIMKKRVNSIWCKAESEAFFSCAEKAGMMRMTWQCRPLANLFEACGKAAMSDQKNIDEVTREYLDMRSEYRRTGKRKPMGRLYD